MIIATKEELNKLLPANVSGNPQRLIALMEMTERSLIVPLLGKPLYEHVCQAYLDEPMPDATEPDRTLEKMQQLIRLIQLPVVHMTLANNAALLSVSLNDAGMNMVSAEHYEATRKEDREAFARDCYLNAHKGIEQLLLFLEEDATCPEPVFLELWRESRSFYTQNALLLPTATAFDRYVPIDQNREMFLTLVPRIRFVQDNRLRPELGDRLMNALIQFSTFQGRRTADQISMQTGGEAPLPSFPAGGEAPHPSFPAGGEAPRPNFPADGEAPRPNFPADGGMDEWDKVCSGMVSEDAFAEDLREFLPKARYAGMTTEERIQLNAWNKALTLVRNALAYYVEGDNKKLKRDRSLDDAADCMNRAVKFIAANTGCFVGVIEESPFFVPAPDTDAGSQPSAPAADKRKPEPPGFVFDPTENL